MKQINCNSQQGTALLFAFVLLIALTFIAIASVNTGVLGVKMASNVEEEMNAFQTAKAVIDFILDDPSAHLPSTGSGTVTALNCTNGACTNPSGNPLPGDTFVTNSSDSIVATVDYSNCGLAPRSAGTSLAAFSAYSYKISAGVDRTENNRGFSQQRQGYMELGPKCI